LAFERPLAEALAGVLRVLGRPAAGRDEVRRLEDFERAVEED
jgi:hypothetical protein